MGKMVEELKEEMKAKNQAFEIIFDILAQTGDPRMVYTKEMNSFRRKITDITINNKITDEQFEKLTSLIKQFSQLFDDVIKEDN